MKKADAFRGRTTNHSYQSWDDDDVMTAMDELAKMSAQRKTSRRAAEKAARITAHANDLISMVSINEAVERVGVSRTTICRWVAAGHFPPPAKAGRNGMHFWHRAVVDAWLDETQEEDV